MRYTQHHFATVIAVVTWLGICWPLLIGQAIPGFRDSAHLYFPLYYWVQSATEERGLPLWNPHDDFGYSLVADASSALFYPGKLLFHFDLIGYPQQFGWYLALHLGLAMWGGIRLARGLGGGRTGAAWAGMAYAFSGPVLFQTTNVIFLVGAAWLPWTLLCTVLARKRRSCRWALAAGLTIAMMILGGDLQTAYLSLLMAAAVFLSWRRAPDRCRVPSSTGDATRFSSWMLLLVTSCVALACGAAQLLPSLNASRESHRAFYDSPRSVWSIAAEWVRNEPLRQTWSDTIGLFSRPVSGTHEEHAYQFSQPPWSLMEWLWPGYSGMPFPINTRWVDAIPGADRMWNPSLYQGVGIPLLIGISFWMGKKRRGAKRSLVWLAGLALLASWGWYGVGWVLYELHWLPLDSSIGEPVGGLYWLMVTFLPGFEGFRYPAKLTLFFSLATAMISGLAIPRFVALGRRTLPSLRWSGLLLLVLTIGSGVSLLRWVIEPYVAGISWTDAWFGPVMAHKAIAGIWLGLVWGGVVAFGIGLVPFLRPFHRRRELAGAALLVILAMDLIVWNARSLPWVPAAEFREMVLNAKEQTGKYPQQWEPLRNWSAESGFRPEWSTESSQNRLREIIAWQRNRGIPKYHLFGRQSGVGSYTSIAALSTLLLQEEILAEMRPELHAKLDGNATIQEFLLANLDEASAMRDARSVQLASNAAWGLLLQDLRNPAAETPKVTRRLASGLDRLREAFGSLFVEASDGRPLGRPQEVNELPLNWEYEPNRIVVHVDMPAAGIILLPLRHSRDWTARLTGEEEPVVGKQTVDVLKVAGMFAGICLPAGTHELILEQRSLGSRAGIQISVLALATVLVLLGMTAYRSRVVSLRTAVSVR